MSSPSYEGVDLNAVKKLFRKFVMFSSPSYEGVDWNHQFLTLSSFAIGSPSYEGVDWNCWENKACWFVRSCSPSYEGVDWNVCVIFYHYSCIKFSLLRGSGLKFFKLSRIRIAQSSPSYEGVDWNRVIPGEGMGLQVLPLTREWIEIFPLTLE